MPAIWTIRKVPSTGRPRSWYSLSKDGQRAFQKHLDAFADYCGSGDLTEEWIKSMRKLPPLNALRSFEAAARHLSFTKAAEELFVNSGSR